MVENLIESEIENFTKEGITVIKGTMPNCSYCVKYEPVFTAVSDKVSNIRFGTIEVVQGSQFKRNYMKAKIGERLGAPGTFLFKNGELVGRKFGYMDENTLMTWIESNRQLMSGAYLTESVPTPQKQEEKKIITLADLSLVEKKALWLDQILAIEKANFIIEAIKKEINK